MAIAVAVAAAAGGAPAARAEPAGAPRSAAAVGARIAGPRAASSPAGAPGGAEGDARDLRGRWPRPAVLRERSLSERLAERMTSLGDALGAHVGALSGDLVAIRIDGHRRAARVRVGGRSAGGGLALSWTGDVQWIDGAARVRAQLDAAVAGRALHLQLPEVQLTAAEHRGARGVVVRVPLLRASF